MVEQSNTKTKRRKSTILLNTQENQSPATPHPVEKNRSRIQTSGPKEQEGRLGKFASSLNSNTPIN